MQLAPGMGPVAVHRWFARGEDWAMHPFFAPHAVAMLSALDDRIKGRIAGPFQVEAAGGVLVGELADDPACLDPRARERRPCVVRLALAAGPMSAPEQDRVLAYLRAMPLPQTPGLDAALLVNVPHVRPAPPRRAEKPPEEKPHRPKWGLLAVALIAAVAVVVWLATRPGTGGKDEKKDGPPKKEKADRDPPAAKGLLDRFAKVDHPHVAFLKARPEALERPRRTAEQSYEDWLRQQGRRFTDEGHPLPRRLRERVNAWREPEAALAEAARRARALRERWGGAEPATLIEEIDVFFDVAVRPDGLPQREELDHPANAFLWRLPRDPIAAGRTFNTEADLRPALAELARRLGASAEGDSQALLTGIEKALDYTAWWANERLRGAIYADKDEEPGPAVAAGLLKFKVRP